MNYLAHFHLASPEPDLVAGALEGDYRKGLLPTDAADLLKRGIQLHRAVDAFTDEHPAVADLRQRFPASLRRYAGILIDLAFDHYLTLHWQRYTSQPLAQFAQDTYRHLRSYEDALSPEAKRMARRLESVDGLTRYDTWESVPASAARVGARFKRGNPLERVDRELDPKSLPLEHHFLTFYPDALAFARDWRAAAADLPTS